MKRFILTCFLFGSSFISICQNVGIGTTTPDASARLDVKSSTTGALMPRMTSTERKAIINPATGLLVFDTVEKTLYMFDGVNWLGFAALTNFQRPAVNLEHGPDAAQINTFMGYSVSMWDQWAAVGAPYVKVNGVATGVVYMYYYEGGQWQYRSTIAPPTSNAGSVFGVSVSIKGNYLAVGSPSAKDFNNLQFGAAFVYKLVGNVWALTNTVYGTTTGTDFASSVAINLTGTVLCTAETGAQVAGKIAAGKVHIFYKPGSAYILNQSLQDPQPTDFENFGTRLALSASGNNLAIGAPYKTVGAFIANGYLGFWDRSGGPWGQAYSYLPAGKKDLNIGANLDITDNKIAFSVGGLNEAHYQNLNQSGASTRVYSDVIYGISLDPVNEVMNVFSGNALYKQPAGGTSYKLKIISTDEVPMLPGLLSGYNGRIIAGLPVNQNKEKPYLGAVYFYE